METYLPLIGLIFWAVASLGVAYLLDRSQQVSRPIPVVRPRYMSRLDRRR
jgi:hypothetical protein